MSEQDSWLNGHLPDDRDAGEPLAPDPWLGGGATWSGPSALHPEIEQQLAALAAGELAPVDRQWVLDHLAGCEACAAALAEVQRIREMLRALGDRPPARPEISMEAPAPLADAVLARLDAPAAPWEEDVAAAWLAAASDTADAPTRAEHAARPVSPSTGVLSPDFRSPTPQNDGRASERDRWRQRNGGHQGESVAMDHRASSRTTDQAPATSPHSAKQRRAHSTPAPARRHALPALAATAALIVLSVALFSALRARTGGLAGGAPGSGSSFTPTPGTPGSALVVPPPSFPIHGQLTSVAMRSAKDGWAVGTQTGAGALILHYDGRQWVQSRDAFPGVTLNSVAVDPAGGAWAVGVMSDQTTGVVLRYAGGHWSAVKMPIQQFNGLKVQAVSRDEAWVLVGLGKGQTGRLNTALLHEQSGSWSIVSAPTSLTDIAMSADGSGWATGADGSILRYQGGQWSTAVRATDGQSLALRMLSTTDGWVAGFTNTTPHGMFLMHYDGAHWARVQGPTAAGPSDLFALDGVSPNDIWAGGDNGDAATMLHYTAGQWQAVPLRLAWQSAPVRFAGTIHNIAMVSSAEGWAVVSAAMDAPVLLHWINGRWTVYVQPANGGIPPTPMPDA